MIERTAPMRAPKNESTSTAGQDEVRAAFSRIGWGPVDNPYHDLGTDLWIAVRDERRFDLGLMVGAQVKSGASWFAEPAYGRNKQLIGWWFREDQPHFDYWLGHNIPHIVIFYDLDPKVSYWVHVTNDAVQSTGKDSKILVPAANIVDEAHRDALIEVAATGAAGVPWEGSIWMAGADIPAAGHLRHALIVPRLIAPHPNAGREQAPSPEQVIAMLMQARLFDLTRFADAFAEIPAPDEAAQSPNWSWQFFGALWDRVTSSRLDLLLDRAADAPDPARRAAATVAAASALIEFGRAEEAVELLSEVVAVDDCEPVDHNWSLVQRARALAEIGQLEAAHDDAVAAQGTRLLAPNDATAGAITASASVLLFNTARWEQRDVRGVMISSDTAAGWWRSQVTTRALAATLDRTFRDWANDRSITFGAQDVAHDQLGAASLTASHTGDQAGWRHQAADQAADSLVRLTRHDDPADAASALSALRMAGDHKGLSLAIRHLSSDGPARAVTLAGSEVDLTRSTRTTGYADLKLLQLGGDLIESAAATAAARSILAILEDPTDFATRTGPSYALRVELLETLAGVVAAAEANVQREVAERALNLAPQEQQLDAQTWGKLLAALPESAFRPEDAAVLTASADQHHFPLPNKMLGVAANLGDQAARESLIEQAMQGSLDALAELGDVRDLDTAVAEAQVNRLADSARRVAADAKRGKFGIGSDVCHALALLNSWHPEVAQWDPVLELLAEDAVMVDDKRAALRLLADVAERIPNKVRDPLTDTVARIARREGEVMHSLLTRPRDASAEAALLAMALGAFDADETSAHITRLLDGEASDRAWAAVIAGRNDNPFNRGLLVSLASDDDPDVRSAACARLAFCAAQSSDPLLGAALRRAGADPGRSVPVQLGFGLQRLRASEDVHSRALAAELREILAAHPSARVRALAEETAEGSVA
jgi:Domain of unknown function (DUF4365)